jgi:hypothetical protein
VKITSHQQFIGELAAAAVALHESGKHAPTAPEIADQYWANPNREMPEVMVIEVRRRLGEVRKALHELGHSVAPVSERYYRLARKAELDYGQIGECLAVGRSKKQAGILFVTEGDLLSKWIKTRYESWVHGTGTGKLVASQERIGRALEDGLITQGEAMSITGTTLYPEDDDYGMEQLED